MPVTFWTFLIGTLALAGCPPFAGFWSKDGIVASAFDHNLAAALVIELASFFTAYSYGPPSCGRVSRRASIRGSCPRQGITSGNDGSAGISGDSGRYYRFSSTVHILHAGTGTRRRTDARDPGFADRVFGRRLSRIHSLSGKIEDPILVPLFANRFYIDQFYGTLVKWTQDLFAQIAGFVDRWIIDGGIVRGLGGATWGCGFALRFLQIGNLQAYAFLFGLGVILLLYLILFAS